VTLLAPALLARLERLQVLTRRRLAGRLSSEHRSVRHGETLDFAEYREYHPGDDFRRVDYQAWARLDQLLVRLFEAEDDLTVRLLVDTSGSMAGAPAPGSGKATGQKLVQAVRVAAALGFVALVRRDVVTLHTFPLDRPAPRFTGRHATHALFARLEAIAAAGAQGDTPFVAAARDLLGRPGPRGLTIVVSDLLTPEWADGLTKLPARGGDLVVIHVLSADELRPDLMGDLDLVDRETGNRVSVSLSVDALRRYEELAVAWADSIARRCQQLGAGYVRILDDDDLEKVLLGRWRTAGILR
jgi:uncharacterized protein (DUF58 family)